jgi:hypothetical protein
MVWTPVASTKRAEAAAGDNQGSVTRTTVLPPPRRDLCAVDRVALVAAVVEDHQDVAPAEIHQAVCRVAPLGIDQLDAGSDQVQLAREVTREEGAHPAAEREDVPA